MGVKCHKEEAQNHSISSISDIITQNFRLAAYLDEIPELLQNPSRPVLFFTVTFIFIPFTLRIFPEIYSHTRMSRFVIRLCNVVGDLIMEGVRDYDEDICKGQKADIRQLRDTNMIARKTIPKRPAASTQSITQLIMGTLPTGKRALEITLVPWLNGYKLSCDQRLEYQVSRMKIAHFSP